MAFIHHLEGMLRGMNRQVGCKLQVWEESSSTGRVYLRCAITNEPDDLPNGEYVLFFLDHRVATRKWEGHWLLKYLPAGIVLRRAA